MALGFEKDWCSSQQAADRFGLTPRTLYRLIDHGQLLAYRFGRVIRLRRREVEDYIGVQGRAWDAGTPSPRPATGCARWHHIRGQQTDRSGRLRSRPDQRAEGMGWEGSPGPAAWR
jgi:excisionase family DNA binding protein